jgi:hypothetical protein
VPLLNYARCFRWPRHRSLLAPPLRTVRQHKCHAWVDGSHQRLGVSDIKQTRDRLNALLLQRIESLVRYLYPDGRREGHSWRVGSFDINLRTGLWGDWDGSTDSMSRNLFDLWMYATQHDSRQSWRKSRTGWECQKSNKMSERLFGKRSPNPPKTSCFPCLKSQPHRNCPACHINVQSLWNPSRSLSRAASYGLTGTEPKRFGRGY